MKPDEKSLEKLVKKLIKGEAVSSADLLFHWNGLGVAGDRRIIRILNRRNGWTAFILWAQADPIAMGQLETILNSAGVPDSAVELARAAGLTAGGDDTLRAIASTIVNLVQTANAESWDGARVRLVANPGLVDSVLEMLEDLENASSATFITKLLEDKALNQEQEKLARKILYRLKQKQIVPEEVVPDTNIQSLEMSGEIFLFSENRVPHWQIAFYFRGHSPFSNSGDLYILQIREGTGFEISEQHPNLRMNLAALKKLAQHYTAELQKKLHLEIPFHVVPPDQARYFFNQSAGLQEGQGMRDFLKFLPAKPAAPLLEPGEAEEELVSSKAEELLQHPYFSAWILDEDRMEKLRIEIAQAGEGAIVLPEMQTREKILQATTDAFHSYFDAPTRLLLGWAFEKAAYFIKTENPEDSARAFVCSRNLRNLEMPVDKIPVAQLLFERTMAYLKEINQKKEEEEKQSSMIISPQEFQRQIQKGRR